MSRFVYSFGGGHADGSAQMRSLLGGKGANLAEMTRIGLPVPPGLTISTEACLAFLKADGVLPDGLQDEVDAAVQQLERLTDKRFGEPDNPLLLSVRSGAVVSMPGMMDTVLNLGINDSTVAGLALRTDNPRFAYDSYRRLIQMYANVVMGIASEHLEHQLGAARERAGVSRDHELGVRALKRLVEDFKQTALDEAGEAFPQDPRDQLFGAIRAVFNSWNTRRAISYRKAQRISGDLGTGVNVQAMVFGNMGDDCATGVAFTRDPSTGERKLFGEWLRNAQGEDVVAGIRTPRPIGQTAEEGADTLAAAMPEAHAELARVCGQLESHYREMQDVEFTVEAGTLWMLQTRTGKRSPTAELRIAVEMAGEGLITVPEAIQRVRPESLERLLHPMVDPQAEVTVIATGIGASPGAGSGHVVFTADDAVEWVGRGKPVILVRHETSPEDIHGMLEAQGILTARGGQTSHAAVVARGISKPCIVGCADIHIDLDADEQDGRSFRVGEHVVSEGQIITIDGSDGRVILGEVPTVRASASRELEKLMSWADELRRLKVFANADTGHDCRVARELGAEGVGLCRTEHMFFQTERIQAVREMILARDETERRRALAKLQPMQKGDFLEIFREMHGLPVTVRLLDPPLHEFLPREERELQALAASLSVPFEDIVARNESLAEVNPMLGHRGCRLGLTYPEIYEMQVRAIIEAACELVRDEGLEVHPEIMMPLIGHVEELARLRRLATTTAEYTIAAYPGVALHYRIGTMIELPRACVTADELAREADFFSFGTNDLTQTAFGLSRDDAGRFLPFYVQTGVLQSDPFVTLDSGVGALVSMACQRGRSVRPDLSLGMCGEHGGDPRSIAFCHRAGLDYVSCSPYRVQVARLAAAQSALETP